MKMDSNLQKIKFSIRSIFIFEQLTDKAFEIKTTSDIYTYYYSCLLAGKEYNKTFDEFIDDCDDNVDAIKWFLSEFSKKNKIDEQFADNNTDKKKSKGKRTVRIRG
jgi:hypothetical protein